MHSLEHLVRPAPSRPPRALPRSWLQSAAAEYTRCCSRRPGPLQWLPLAGTEGPAGGAMDLWSEAYTTVAKCVPALFMAKG